MPWVFYWAMENGRHMPVKADASCPVRNAVSETLRTLSDIEAALPLYVLSERFPFNLPETP